MKISNIPGGDTQVCKYELKDGTYFLTDAETGEVLREMDEVAIAFTISDAMWTLHKHGSTELVQRWHDRTVKKLRDAGFDDLADEMAMISGKFPVEELNRCIDTTGYIGVMVKKLGLNIT